MFAIFDFIKNADRSQSLRRCARMDLSYETSKRISLRNRYSLEALQPLSRCEHIVTKSRPARVSMPRE